MGRLENVAPPPTAGTVAVPDSVPPPGVAPLARVMHAAAVSAGFPNASSPPSSARGEMDAPAVAFAGWTVKASLEAAAGLMVNAAEVAPVSAPDAAVRV